MFNDHRIPDRQQALLDLAKLISVHIFKDKGLAQSQRLAVHFEDSLSILVFNPEIISNGEHFLTNFVTSRHRSPLCLGCGNDLYQYNAWIGLSSKQISLLL